MRAFEATQRKHTFQVRREMEFDEAQRLAILRERPAPNPGWMSRLIRVRRIGRGFVAAHGHCPVLGEITRVDAYTAKSLVALQRAEYVDGPPDETP